MERQNDVVVVGAGIAGLACAALLGRAGRSVTLLEAGAEPGGLARTRAKDGFLFNRGAHALYRGGAAQAVLSSLGIEPVGRPPSLGGVAFYQGQRHRLPTTPWGMLTTGLLSLRGRGATLKTFARLPRIQPGPGSAAAWLEEITPDASARAFLASMLRLSTYSGDLGKISAAAAADALRQASQHGVVYLDGGWQQLVTRLVESCAAAGVEIVCRAPVEQVVAGQVTLRDGTRLDAEEVVLAVAPSVARRWVDVPELGHAQVACLDVALRERPKGPGLAFDLDDPMYLSVHSDTAALGPKGGAVVHTLHYGAPDDARKRLEGLLDRTLAGWRDDCVHAQFLPKITVTEGIVPPQGRRPGVRVQGIWRVGDAVGEHGALADAAFGSAQEVARAIVDSAAGGRAA
ncbi:MAG: phytoene desaturase family protein [Nannocystales bacterium]